MGYHIPMSRPIAAFDIDGTVFRSVLLDELIQELVRREVLSKVALKHYASFKDKYERTGAGIDQYIDKAVEAFGRYAKGVPYGDVADIAGEIIEAQKDHVFRYAKDLIYELKQEGYFLLAVSRSPKFIVDGFGYELGFNKSYGIFFETGATGRFTGEIVDEHIIYNKGAVLQRAVKKEKLTFANSIAVGDSESDISLLELADMAIAFNPTKRLLKHARQHEWKVVHEVKDTILES